MHKRRCEASPTHVYHIKKVVKLLNIRYTQHESIYRRDVKLPLHIGNTYQNIFNTNFDNTVGCLKITEDKSLKSRIQTPDARLIIATSAVPRREG